MHAARLQVARWLTLSLATPWGCKGVDAFHTQQFLAPSVHKGRSASGNYVISAESFDSSTNAVRYPFHSLTLKQQLSSSSSENALDNRSYKSKSNHPQKFQRKGRRKYNNGNKDRGNNNNRSTNLASRSRSILNSFEDACQRDRRNSSSGDINSMVQDLLDGTSTTLLQESQAETNTQQINLSNHILPRDASSLIRLLGRNNAHDAMLQFTRRYCRDIMDNAAKANNNSKYQSKVTDAKEAILFAYTAAIAACSKPPLTSLASSKEPRHGFNSTTTTTSSKYRSKSFLLSLLEEMEHDYTTEEGEKDGRFIWPNSYTLSAVLLGVDDAVEALELLEEFEEKYRQGADDSYTEEGNEGPNDSIVTVQVYNVVVASCSKSSSSSSNKNSGGWQQAISILQRMKRLGPEPNEQTYSLILQACAESSQMKVAMSIIDEIRQSSPVTPSAKLYIPLLKVCAKKMPEMAMSLINIMKEDSLELSTETMNLYLSALAKGKMVKESLGVLQEMLDENSTLVPDIVTFNTVLSACANADDFEGAQALLEQMKDGMFIVRVNGDSNKVEIRPDIVSYNSVISCAPDPEFALALIQEMRLTRRKREGVIVPNSITYVNAITQCRKASLEDGDPTSSFEIAMYLLDLAREESVDLNVFVYSASIWMAESVGDYHTAVNLLREMKCQPNNVCYDGVISCLSQKGAGLHREALYLYYEMKHLGLSPSRKTYQRLVYALDNSRDSELSKNCQKKAALLTGVLSSMDDNDRNVNIGGPIFESLIKNQANATNPSTSYQTARMTFDSIVGPVDDACLSAMLRVCSSATPIRWQEALMLIHSSDIVNRAYGPGLISRRALSNAVIACSKANQWEESLNLIELYGNEADQDGGVVSVAAMNAVIRASGRSSRPDIAVQLLNDMPGKYRVTPDELSYRLAIIACNQAEHQEMRNRTTSDSYRLTWWQCALSLLRRMREDDIKPSLQAYSSAISACEAAGQWQRALGILQMMPAFSSLLGVGPEEATDAEPANLFCLNAAISACEKGGAWVEALQLYESIRSSKSGVKPNFVTLNSLLIALDKADQQVLAETVYREALQDKIVSPWKRRFDNDDCKMKTMMDLHQFSAPMSKIAVRSHMDFLLLPRKKKDFGIRDFIIIVGKGKHSEDKPVLLPTILHFLHEEFGIEATIDEHNKGRIRVSRESIEAVIERINDGLMMIEDDLFFDATNLVSCKEEGEDKECIIY